MKIEEFNSFEKNVFKELRCLIIDENVELEEHNLVKAMTVNENLKSLGYTLKPQGVISLAKSNCIDEVFNKVKSFEPEISAKPMYPDFPMQVMKLEEGVFRFHQMVHYFSTYGMELVFNIEVKTGWLPDVNNTDKDEIDFMLLDSKVLDVVSLSGVYTIVSNKIISKTERMTIPEKEIAKHVVLNNIFNQKFNVTFKENIQYIVSDELDSNVKSCKTLIKNLCKHTGDILDYINYSIITKKFKQFKTSQKRMFVELLESYSNYDFEENLSLKRERNLTILRYLSYNRFSKNDLHKEAVRRLRNKELHTWMSKVETLIKSTTLGNKDSEQHSLEFIGSRPGVLLRMAKRLLKLGFSKKLISIQLCNKSSDISMQTLITIATYFGQDLKSINEKMELNEEQLIDDLNLIINEIISCKLSNIETPMKNKKVFVDTGIYNFDHSLIELNDKSQEGGYIRSGLAINIPDSINRLRFFTYWNDKTRIDIDLHAKGQTLDRRLVHVGWNGDFNSNGIVHSGDITHSNAAEYIDIDFELAKNVDYIKTNIRSYTGVPFKDIKTVFTGMMAVENINEKVKLYNNKNVFFRHDLKDQSDSMDYALIDIQNKVLKLLGSKIEKSTFTISKYLNHLLLAQNVNIVKDINEADIVITLDKSSLDNSISLIDENYFIEI